jgi:imidazolonepropionase-like amidohydrolase
VTGRRVRHLFLTLATVAAAAVATPTGVPAQVTAVRFGRLIDGRGGVIQDAVVLVEGERITRVGSGDAAVPAAAAVIDLRRYTGIPGLIDAHTHVSFAWDRAPGTRPWAQFGTLSPVVTAFLAQENLRKTLESGVTTVRDLGSWEYIDLALRHLITRGLVVGPRMFVAGYGLHVSQSVPRPGHLELAEMARRGTFYAPTVDHNRYYVEHREEYGYDQAAVDRLNDYIKRNFETLKRAARAKVKIVMASDAVFTGFGENTRELEWFVKAGMTPAQALATATTNGAARLGREKELGAVGKGYFADLVAVEGDPLADIEAVVHGVRWVMKGGRVVVDRSRDATASKP